MTPQRILDSLAVADRAALEARLADFDRRWYDGKFNEAVAALPAADSVLRLPLLMELIKIELERQWQIGNHVVLDAFLAPFPELQGSTAIVAELAEAERQVRERFGVASAPNELRLFDGVPQLQAGRYRVVRKLGQGNMGAVYLAEDTRLGRHVALKVPHFPPEEEREARERFFREARALAAVHHPNLCPIFDVGQEHGIPFLTMAYLEGGSLAQRLKQSPPWPQHAAAALVRRLALGLAQAHDRGIIHRDLKPANILLTAGNEPVVVDFGLARRVSADEIRLTGTGWVVGTPAYMAPEQATGNSASLGPACDIYSLAVVLYELLTGRLPFEGSVTEVLVAVREQPPVPLATYRPDIDPQLEAICKRALAKQPQDRYPTMRDFAAALEHFLRSGPDSALVKSLDAAGGQWLPKPKRGSRPRWRRRLAWAAIVFVASLLSVAGWSLSHPSPEPSPGKSSEPIDGKTPLEASVQYAPKKSFQGHQGNVVGAAFSAEAGTVISGGADHTVRFWKVGTGEEKVESRWKLGPLTEVLGLAANGRYVLTSTLESLSLWQVEGRREVRHVTPGGPHLDAFAVTSDGHRFMGGIREVFGKPLVRVWDVDAEQPLGSWTGHSATIACVALSSDGRRAVSASADGLRVWDVPSGKLLHQPKHVGVVSLAIAPAGDRSVSGSVSGSIRLWETDTGRDLGRLDGHTAAVLGLAFSSDGGRVVSAGEDRTVRLWQLAPVKELACLHGHSAAVTCLALSPAGDRVLSGSKDGELRLWGPE